jgi:2-polyprenyl-3-methyl-5-hydroxy-6-metoxy-1,4-benzoquinol methylase
LANQLWENSFGRKATWRLQRRILPELRWNQEIWGETVRQHLLMDRPLRWLDAGCGWRLLAKDLEALEHELVGLARSVVGVDLDLPHLCKHEDISQRACASLDRLPFAQGSFDVVTCNMVAEHLPAPLTVFQELERVLAPGGVLLVHTPNTQNYLVFANIVAKKFLPRSAVLKLIGDSRASEDVYPTYYRANSARVLRMLGESVDLYPEYIRFLSHPQPYCRSFLPAALLELLLMRALMTPALERFGATIVISFRKQSASSMARAA